jgi:hypothetical protein
VPLLNSAILKGFIKAYSFPPTDEDEKVGKFSLTSSVDLSVHDVLNDQKRNDVYITINMDQFINAALTASLPLPREFNIQVEKNRSLVSLACIFVDSTFLKNRFNCVDAMQLS